MSGQAMRWERALAHMAQLRTPTEDTNNVAAVLERVCRAAADVLTASGAEISVMTQQGSRGFIAASDAASRGLADLQFTLGEGPCLECLVHGRPILVPDLSGEALVRWPVYVPAARERGVRALFAFPIQIGASRIGVLDVFRDQPGPLEAEQLDQALTFADLALMIVLDGQERAPAGAVPAGFGDEPGFRAEIAQAQGMIMVQLGVTITEALVRLRARAYAEGRVLGDVARDIVARRVRFDENRP